MKPHLVHFTAVAERHLRDADEWWETNHSGSPGLFARELTEAVQQLVEAPYCGVPYNAPRPAGARRLLLRKTRHHVYFTVDDARGVVTIRAIWHSARKRPPRLR